MKNKPTPETITLDEAGIADALKGAAIRAVKNVGNRVMYGVGSQFGWGNEAKGRLDLNAASRFIYKDWRQYVGRKGIKGDPSLGDMSNFLKSTYNLEISSGSLRAIAQGKSDAEPAGDKTPDEPSETPSNPEPNPTSPPEPTKELPPPEGVNPPDGIKPPKAKESVIYTSVKEYYALKKIFGKGTLFEAEPETNQNEESEEEIASKMKLSPENLRAFFPMLANELIDRRMLSVTRNGEVIGGDGSGVDRDSSSDDPADNGQTASARVTKDGSSIDIVKMKRLMTADKITKNDMAFLKKLIKTPGEKSFNDISKDASATKTMVSLVSALVMSINKGNKPNDIRAQHSITADGHVIDINDFTEYLSKRGVTGGDIEKIRTLLKTNGKNDLMKIISNHNSRDAKVIYWLATAALRSISTENKPKKSKTEKPETPEPPKA